MPQLGSASYETQLLWGEIMALFSWLEAKIEHKLQLYKHPELICHFHSGEPWCHQSVTQRCTSGQPASPNRPHVFLFSRKVIAEKVRSQIVYNNIIHVKESGRDSCMWLHSIYTSMPWIHWYRQPVKLTNYTHTRRTYNTLIAWTGFHKVMERNRAKVRQLAKIFILFF